MTLIEKAASWDTDLFLLLNGFHNDFWDTVMYWASDKYFWVPFYAILLVLIGVKLKWKNLLVILPLIALLILLSDQGSVLLKNLFQRYRPCHNFMIQDIVHTLNGKCGGQYGFVSSHAANTFALAMFVGMLFRKNSPTPTLPKGEGEPTLNTAQYEKNLKWMLVFMLFWAGFVSYSRIYLGVHYPADIVAGALLGAGVGFLLVKGYFYLCKNINT